MPIHAAYVCPLDWNDLSPNGPGRRHCGTCRRVVYDVRDCRVDRVESLLAAHGGTVCGRYVADRLGRPLFAAATLLAASAAHADGNVPVVPADDPDAPADAQDPTTPDAPATDGSAPADVTPPATSGPDDGRIEMMGVIYRARTPPPASPPADATVRGRRHRGKARDDGHEQVDPDAGE